jgi:hypothetical protein
LHVVVRNGFAPSSMLLLATSLYEPHLGSNVQMLKIFPHPWVNRSPLNLNYRA